MDKVSCRRLGDVSHTTEGILTVGQVGQVGAGRGVMQIRCVICCLILRSLIHFASLPALGDGACELSEDGKMQYDTIGSVSSGILGLFASLWDSKPCFHADAII